MGRTTFAGRTLPGTAGRRTPDHLRFRQGWIFTPETLAFAAVMALAGVGLVGPLGVLSFVALTGVLIAVQPLFNLRQLVFFSPILMLPLLCMGSTLWSDSPPSSMRGGLELLLTYVTSMVVCRNISVERLVLALFLYFLLVAVLLLPYVPPAVSAGAALVAWMGSKNQVGFSAFMLFALALAVVADGRQHWIARLAALPSLGLALFLARLAQSGGTTTSIILTLAVFPPLALLTAVRVPVRIALALLALALALLALVFQNDLVAAFADFRQNVLNKDATLTGRTYLWEFAHRLSAARPVLGYGYGAFWRQGNIDAEGLWRWGGVPNRGGFNFHNTFVEFRVGLGIVGVVVLAANCIVIAALGLARQLARPSVAFAAVLAINAVNYSRSFVEEGLVSPFSLATLLWIAAALFAFPGDGRGLAGLTLAGPRSRKRTARAEAIGTPAPPRHS